MGCVDEEGVVLLGAELLCLDLLHLLEKCQPWHQTIINDDIITINQTMNIAMALALSKKTRYKLWLMLNQKIQNQWMIYQLNLLKMSYSGSSLAPILANLLYSVHKSLPKLLHHSNFTYRYPGGRLSRISGRAWPLASALQIYSYLKSNVTANF